MQVQRTYSSWWFCIDSRWGIIVFSYILVSWTSIIASRIIRRWATRNPDWDSPWRNTWPIVYPFRRNLDQRAYMNIIIVYWLEYDWATRTHTLRIFFKALAQKQLYLALKIYIIWIITTLMFNLTIEFNDNFRFWLIHKDNIIFRYNYYRLKRNSRYAITKLLHSLLPLKMQRFHKIFWWPSAILSFLFAEEDIWRLNTVFVFSLTFILSVLIFFIKSLKYIDWLFSENTPIAHISIIFLLNMPECSYAHFGINILTFCLFNYVLITRPLPPQTAQTFCMVSIKQVTSNLCHRL